MSVNIKDSSSENGLRRIAGRGRAGSDITKTSQLTNDSDFQTGEDVANTLQDYAKKTDIPNLDVLNKFTLDESGKLLFDGKPIETTGGSGSADIVEADDADIDSIFTE